MGYVRFAWYCGKIYSRHLFSYGRLTIVVLITKRVTNTDGIFLYSKWTLRATICIGHLEIESTLCLHFKFVPVFSGRNFGVNFVFTVHIASVNQIAMKYGALSNRHWSSWVTSPTPLSLSPSRLPSSFYQFAPIIQLHSEQKDNVEWYIWQELCASRA